MTQSRMGRNISKCRELNSAVLSEDIKKLKALLKKNDASTEDKKLLLRAAAMTGKLNSLKVLLDSGAELQQSTAIVAAAGYGQYECLKFLCEQGADVNEVDFRGESALISATRFKHHKCAKFLIQNGADKNYLSSKGKSALIVASKTTNFDMMRLLLLAGSDVNKGSAVTVSPLFWLTSRVRHKCRGSVNVLVELAKCEHDKCLKLLINEGADVNIVNSEGRTPLMNACEKENSPFVEILLQSGADVNARNSTRDTALMTACRTQYTGCTKILLKYGADVNALDNTQFNALSMIKRQNLVATLQVYKTAAQILFAAGIKILQMTDFVEKCMDELHGPGKNVDDLKSLCRYEIRINLQEINPRTNLFVLVPKLPLPPSLMSYLLFNVSIDD